MQQTVSGRLGILRFLRSLLLPRLGIMNGWW